MLKRRNKKNFELGVKYDWTIFLDHFFVQKKVLKKKNSQVHILPYAGEVLMEWVGRKEQFITVASWSISTKTLKFHPQIFPVYWWFQWWKSIFHWNKGTRMVKICKVQYIFWKCYFPNEAKLLMLVSCERPSIEFGTCICMAKRKVESKEWFETAFIPTGSHHWMAGWKHKFFGCNIIFW